MRGRRRRQHSLVHLPQHVAEPRRLGQGDQLPRAVQPAGLHQLHVEVADGAEPHQRHGVLRRVEALVGHERRVHRARHLGHAGQVAGRHRLLDGVESEALQRVDPADGLLDRPRLVGVHRESDRVAHRLAHGAEPGDVEGERLEPDPDLEDAEALRHVGLGLGRGFIGRPVEQALRARHPVRPAASEPAVERDARRPRGEVVERDVQDGLGGGVPGEGPVELGDRRAPLAQRAADDERGEVVPQRRDDAGRALAREVRHVPADLAPAHLPVVGGEADEDLLQRGHPPGEVGEAG